MGQNKRPPGRKKGIDDSEKHPPGLGFEFPPADFDPVKASPREIASFGLPPKPGRDAPALRSAWLRMFERPLIFVHPKIVTEDLRVPPQEQFRQLFSSPSRIETSRNWCGATIVPHGGRQFVQIWGEWNVPTPSLPPPEERGPAGQINPYACSTWIGLDGNRRYFNASLPQTGTEQRLIVQPDGSETVECSAWFQWWARTQNSLTKVTFTNIDIAPGMSVMALIWVIGPLNVVVWLRTFAPNNQITRLPPFPPPPLEPPLSPEARLRNGQLARPRISGATAEWIMERPATGTSEDPRLELFPAYDTVEFRHCVTGTAATAGVPTAEEILLGPRYLRMYEVPAGPPSRTRIMSISKRISTTSVRADYGDFKD